MKISKAIPRVDTTNKVLAHGNKKASHKICKNAMLYSRIQIFYRTSISEY